MALPAIRLMEVTVEERVARLEANVEHIRSDMGETKLDLRRLNEKTDDIKESLGTLALHVERSFSELKVSRAMDRVWFLLMSAALLGIMARAFEWIRMPAPLLDKQGPF